jgi:hypothetical protein
MSCSRRLEWLSAALAYRASPPDRDGRSRRLDLASVAAEYADQFDDDWIHDVVVSITTLATQLDYDSRQLAFSLVSTDWWGGAHPRAGSADCPRPVAQLSAGSARSSTSEESAVRSSSPPGAMR